MEDEVVLTAKDAKIVSFVLRILQQKAVGNDLDMLREAEEIVLKAFHPSATATEFDEFFPSKFN
jgi:hypothetical protein